MNLHNMLYVKNCRDITGYASDLVAKMERLQAKSVLKEQIGSKGFYAEVTLHAQLLDGEHDSIHITFDDGVDSEWREAAAVGIRMGWRCLPEKHKHRKCIQFTIGSISSMPCDTTETVVMFVSAQAVLKLFSSPLSNAPTFVKEFGIFIFPK